MSMTTDKLSILGLIVKTIQKLNNKQGSRVSDIILAMTEGTLGETEAFVFDEQCRKIAISFIYGIEINVLLFDSDKDRYKLSMSAADAAKFLMTLKKSPKSRPVAPTAKKPKAIFSEIESDEDNTDFNKREANEKRRYNRSVTDLQSFKWTEESDNSECEII